jgi:hypothetical protein
MTPEELARSKREAHQLSDAQLGVLLREGASGLPSDAWDVLQDEKAEREAQELSDAALGKLLREGPDSQQNGAWDVLKEEEERRERVRAESLRTPHTLFRRPPSDASIEEEEEERRYPALRAIIAIHQGIAILALVLGVVIALKEPNLGGMSRVGVLVVAVLVSLFQWAVAETLQVVIDIEANTRRTSTR